VETKKRPDTAGSAKGRRRLAALGELPDGKPVLRSLGGRRFLTVRRGDTVHVCGNTCPHRGAPLNEGLLVGGEIVCPCHQARFDLKSGAPAAAPARDDLPVYDAQVVEGEVMIGSPRRAVPWYVPKGTGKRRILILGAGAAGSAAAENLRREGFGGRLILAGAEHELPYDRTALSKSYLGESTSVATMSREADSTPAASVPVEFSAPDLRPAEFYEQARIELYLGRKALTVEPARKTVEFESGEKLRWDSLLLATGGIPRRLGLPGEDLSGVHTLRSRADAGIIGRAAAAAGRVVILGAGFLGLELAGSLSRLGLEVAVVAPEVLPLSRVFGEQVGRWVLEQQRALGVRFRLGMTAQELLGDGKIRHVLLSDGTRHEADLVIEAVGIEPATAYLDGTGLLRAGAVLVDDRQRTESADIYAAGDLAAVKDAAGAAQRFEHWTEAETQGRRAARAMLGLEPAAAGPPFFWSEVGDFTVKSVGLFGAAASRQGVRMAVRGRILESNFVVAYYDPSGESGRLLGACAVGRDRELIAAGEHLRYGLSLPEEELRDESFDLADRLSRLLRPENTQSGGDTTKHRSGTE
jgi:NADPH-dependent 2,4-dienoyl-CoA reductase/sulfur reductase-like enzyme/nitrite reductase/ring-hydroxylating ferredoxin subunit